MPNESPKLETASQVAVNSSPSSEHSSEHPKLMTSESKASPEYLKRAQPLARMAQSGQRELLDSFEAGPLVLAEARSEASEAGALCRPWTMAVRTSLRAQVGFGPTSPERSAKRNTSTHDQGT